MDPRLRTAIDASVGWYEDLCTLHGVGSMPADALWSALEPAPPLLRRAHFRILARLADRRVVAGAVARLGSGTVDVSNVYAVPGHRVDWAELAEVVGSVFPDRPLVGYERGEALTAALAGGFAPVGELRVWFR